MSIGVWACSQGDPQPGLIPDPPKSDASSSGGGDAKSDVVKQVCATEDGGCSQLENCGSKIFIVDVAADPPQPQGGANVPDGTYVLTDYRVYTGAGGNNGQTTGWFTQTMSFATEATDGGTVDGATVQQMHWEQISANNFKTAQVTSTGTAHFSGTSLVIDIACPSLSAFDSTFSVTGTQIILFVDDPDGKAQLTYTKQ
jgi:hypothetical protein